MTDDYTNAEIVRSLHRIEETQAATNRRLDSLAATYVTRDEHEKDITRIESAVAGMKPPPWTSVAPVLISAAMLIVTLVTLYANHR